MTWRSRVTSSGRSIDQMEIDVKTVRMHMARSSERVLTRSLVWISEGLALRRSDIGLLTDLERNRAERFERAADRNRSLVAAVMLRRLAAKSLGLDDLRAVEIDRTCDRCERQHGRPRVVGSSFDVSVSHSGPYVVVAASSVARVGVDVEDVEGMDKRPFRKLAEHVCADVERRHVTDYEDLVTYWTRKEAVLKATGVGLEYPLQHLTVSSPREAPELVWYGENANPKIRLFEWRRRCGTRLVLAEAFGSTPASSPELVLSASQPVPDFVRTGGQLPWDQLWDGAV